MGTPASIRYVNADDALRLVNKHAVEMAALDARSERGYAHLGRLLMEVSEMQYWRVRYVSFRDYLTVVSQESKRPVAQLQRYFLTVRDLSDVFSLEQLEQIGITKAMQLRKAKDYAIVLPAAVVTAALDSKVTARDLKTLISMTLKMPEEDEDGEWMDLGFEFYASAEERATIEDAIKAAEHAEPLTKKTISESMQKKDIVLKWAMNFLADYSPEGNS